MARTVIRDLNDKQYQARRFSNIKANYGITMEEYYAFLQVQDWRCAICEDELDETRTHGIHVDHCHDTNVIRGMLCGYCNKALGFFEKQRGLFNRCEAYVSNNHGIPILIEKGRPGRKAVVMTAEERAAKKEADKEKRKIAMRERRAKAVL